jgi:hypothetical protein
MTIESYDNTSRIKYLGLLANLFDHSLVTAVHPVICADRDDTTALFDVTAEIKF